MFRAIPLHRKWNGSKLLPAEKEFISSLTGYQTTQDVYFFNRLKTRYSQKFSAKKMAKNQLQHASLTYHKFAGIVPSWKFKKCCCCYKCCFVLLYCRKKQRSINIASFRSKHFRNVINLPEKLETKPDIHKSLKPILDLLKNFRKITSKHLYLSPSSVKL